MKLVSYGQPAHWRSGVLLEDNVVDIATLSSLACWSDDEQSNAGSIRGLLEFCETRLGSLEASVAKHMGTLQQNGAVHDLEKVHLGPPVPDPRKIICTGLNYTDHANEVGMRVPTVPVFFPKYANSLVGPTDDIIPPFETNEVDYEAELAFVIGKRGRYISEEDALGYVAGGMAFNDVSARDLQLATRTWTGGKAIDTFAPCGPALVTTDEVGDFQALGVKTRVDGKLVQDGSTSNMVFSVAYLVSFLSKIMTLEPGDIVATGTPAGVGKSFDPPLYLEAGSVVEIEIERIGIIQNTVVEPRIFEFSG